MLNYFFRIKSVSFPFPSRYYSAAAEPLKAFLTHFSEFKISAFLSSKNLGYCIKMRSQRT